MASAGEKSLAVGHIPGFQIDPNQEMVSEIISERLQILCRRAASMHLATKISRSANLDKAFFNAS